MHIPPLAYTAETTRNGLRGHLPAKSTIHRPITVIFILVALRPKAVRKIVGIVRQQPLHTPEIRGARPRRKVDFRTAFYFRQVPDRPAQVMHLPSRLGKQRQHFGRVSVQRTPYSQKNMTTTALGNSKVV